MADKKEESTGNSELDAMMDAPLQASGNEIQAGSYPGILYKFGAPFDMDQTKSKFYRPGQPEKRKMFHAQFCVYDKNGVPAQLDYMIAFPTEGLANRRSNLFKMLKALSAKSDLVGKDGGFKKGTSLKSFIGLKAVLTVEMNEKDFPNVKNVGPEMDGVKYPTLKEAKELPAGSDNIPF